MDGARGSMARPGTKNTASHLARRLAPGLNKAKRESPAPGLTTSAMTITAKRIMHPASWDGKATPLALNSLSRPLSMARKYAALISCVEVSEAAAPPRAARDVEEVEAATERMSERGWTFFPIGDGGSLFGGESAAGGTDRGIYGYQGSRNCRDGGQGQAQGFDPPHLGSYAMGTAENMKSMQSR